LIFKPIRSAAQEIEQGKTL